MKAADLRDRTTEDLAELEKSLAEERFQNKFKNFTNRLDDTSLIRKNKRDLARVKLILTERARGIAVVAKPKAEKPKSLAPTAEKAAKVASAAKASTDPASHARESDSRTAPTKKITKAAPTAKAAAPAKKPTATKTEKGETK